MRGVFNAFLSLQSAGHHARKTHRCQIKYRKYQKRRQRPSISPWHQTKFLVDLGTGGRIPLLPSAVLQQRIYARRCDKIGEKIISRGYIRVRDGEG